MPRRRLRRLHQRPGPRRRQHQAPQGPGLIAAGSRSRAFLLLGGGLAVLLGSLVAWRAAGRGGIGGPSLQPPTRREAGGAPTRPVPRHSPGTGQLFELTYTETLVVRSRAIGATARAAPATTSLRARVEIATHSIDDEGITVGWRLLDPRFDETGHLDVDADWLASLAHEFRIRQDPAGRPIEFLFDPSVDESGRTFLRGSLGLGFQVVLVEGEGDRWQVEESSDLGPYTATYRIEAAPDGTTRILKEVVDPGAGERTLELEAIASYSPARGGLDRIEYQARARGPSGPFERIVTRHGLLQRVDADPRPIDAGPPTERLPTPPDLRPHRAATLLDQQTVDQLLAPFRRGSADGLLTDEQSAALTILLSVLTARPEAALEVAEAMVGGTIEPSIAGALIASLAAIGTPAGDDALVLLSRRAGLDPALRASSISALGYSPRNAPEVEQFLQGLAEADHGELGLRAVESLAALARRLKGTDGERARGIAHFLDGRYRSAGTRERLRILGAIRETASEASLPTVRTALESPTEDERVGGVRALASFEAEEAEHLLATVARDDASPKVRASAIQILALRPTPGARQALVDALGDPDGAVRRAAVDQILFHAGDDGQVRRHLERLADEDPDPAVRQAAGLALGR